MEKITPLSRIHFSSSLVKGCLFVFVLIWMAPRLAAQFSCEASVPEYDIVINNPDECIDILDVNMSGLCCSDSVSAGAGCVRFNLEFPEGVCLSLDVDGQLAEGIFFVDNCTRSQYTGSNIVPPMPTTTSMSLIYCIDAAGSHDLHLCAKECCLLDIECPVEDGGVFDCIEDVPPAATTLAEFLQLPGARINDYCDPIAVDVSDVNMGGEGCVGDTGFIHRLYTVEDAYHSVTCLQVFAIVDTTPPTFTSPRDTILSCEFSTSPDVTGDITDANDNCEAHNATVDYEDQRFDGSCPFDYRIERVWTVQDDCGNSREVVQNIVVVDTTPPTFDVPRDTVVVCQSDTSVAALGDVQNISDNCGSEFELGHRDVLVTSPCPMSYTVWRIWSVEDDCGLVAVDTQTIQVVDTIRPTYALPPDMVLDCSDDTSYLVTGQPQDLDDNCHSVSISHYDVIMPSVICPANYDFDRVWIIEDECGNRALDTQRFEVRDVTPPDVVGPPDTTVSCEANLSMANLGQLIDTTDDCSVILVNVVDDTVSYTCPGTYLLRRTWEVMDLCGNPNSAVQMINVIDTTAPLAIFPGDLTIPCLADTTPAATGYASGVDYCSDEVVVSHVDNVILSACAAEFTIERAWSVADSCGNAVRDTQMIQVECIESIGLAKTISNIDPPSSHIRGNFNVVFQLTFANDGNTKLHNIELEDNLALALGFNFVGVTPGGEPRVVFSTADTTPVLNASFNGQSNIDIFDGVSGCLRPGQSVTVEFTVEVNPQLPGTPHERLNQAVVKATGPCLLLVQDYSDTGIHPFGSNPGELGNTGGSDDPTILPLECVGPGAPQMSCNKHTNISLDENCSLDFPASVILEGDDNKCDIFYELMITDHHGNPVPSPIPGDLKGETLYVKVIDAIFGNSCWGTILVEDKFKPTIECANDTVYCNALDSVPPPVYYDNCDPNPVLSLIRSTKEDLVCDPLYTKRITKYWQAEDNCGNKSDVCQQIIMLRRVHLDSIEFPKHYTLDNNCALKCNGVYPLDSLGHPSPEYTGAPSIDGIPLYPYYLHCNVSTDYTDRVINHGPCVVKIMRMWRVIEWHCSSSAYREVPQLIHIIDDEPPIIECPDVDYVTTNGGYECEADVHLPPARVYDSCSHHNVRVDIVYPGGILQNSNGGTITLPFGVHQIRYIAYDECHNASECTVEVEVADHTPPVTVCDGFTTVGLNQYGEAHLYAQTLDDGTYDDCYLDSFAVRRMDMGSNCNHPDTLFKSYVRFCCADVGTNVMVVFRAWDKAGNHNDCMVEVEVQDKVPPVIYCPPNITISCDYHFDMDSLGQTFGTIVQNQSDRKKIEIDDPILHADGPLIDGFVLENCEVDIREFVLDSVSQCRTGEILRGFEVTDAQGLQTQCYQKITIIDVDPFDSLDIKWPLDFESSICGTKFHPDSLPVEYGRPILNDDKCSLVGMEWTDDVFSFVQDSLVCFKVLRKWKVIDWCNFRMVNNTYVYEKWEHEQIIKVHNVVGPQLTGDCDSVSVCTYDPDCEDGLVNLTMTASDDCTPDQDLRYSVHIDLNRDGRIDTSYQGVGAFANATDFYPIGEHYVIWSFEDQCGNKTTCRQYFEVVNCKAPTAYCKNGIVVELMPIDTNNDGTVDVGMIDVWARDLDEASFHPCGNAIAIAFSLDTNDIYRRYNCDSLGMREVTIYVIDKKSGVHSSCKTFVEIQDNRGACPNNTITVSGALNSRKHEGIENVNVNVNGSMQMQQTFDVDYTFSNLSMHGSYTITPIKDDNHMNGISTKDLVMLQRHLLGLTPMDDPYMIIAADANNDQEISVRDLAEIRRLILGHNLTFPNNQSWRFVSNDYVFLDPLDPLAETFDEVYDILDITGDRIDMDFTGIKIGDLDGSADVSGLGGNATRNATQFGISMRKHADKIDVIAGEPIDMAGLQMTLNLGEGITLFSTIEDGKLLMTPEQIGLNDMDKGLVRIAWTAPQGGVKVEKGDLMFSLHFGAGDANAIVASVQNYPLQSEVYTTSLEGRSIELIDQKNKKSGLTIYQNQPNPFDRTTHIGVESSAQVSASLKVFDASGRVYIERTVLLAMGVNIFEVSHADLSGTGVYYYQISTSQGSETKKMILIE